MKYCINCGNEINENDEFCTKCGTKVYEDINDNKVTEVKKEENTNDVDKGLYFCGASLGILFIKFITVFVQYTDDWFTDFFYTFLSIPGLMAMTILIAGMIACPKSKPVKITFGVLLVPYILMLLFVIWIYIMCSSFDASGCN